MNTAVTTLPFQAADLAKSLLEVWLSGDSSRLGEEIDSISRMPDPAAQDDESDRADLVKGIALRMKDSPDLFTSQPENPRFGAWIGLLHHLSTSGARTI